MVFYAYVSSPSLLTIKLIHGSLASRVREDVGRHGWAILWKVFSSGGEDYSCRPPNHEANERGRLAALHTPLP
jgi:hypothetical protein